MTVAGAPAPLRCAIEDGVGHLVLDRPRALNTLTAELVDLLAAQLTAWATDERVREIMVRGSGDRAFCAGADVKAIRDLVRAGRAEAAGEFWAREYSLIALLAGHPKPVTVVPHGFTMGAGLGLAAFAHRRLIRPGTQLAMPETRIGFFTDAGISRLFARCPGELGTYLALTGATFGAADALALGFADDLAPDHLAAGGPTAPGPAPVDPAARDGGHAAHEPTRPNAASGVGEPELPAQREWIDECFAGDDVAAIIDRLAGHTDPRARECAAVSRTRSPLALCATLARVRAAADEPDLATTLAADTALARRLTAGPDFVEGVRAVLVDKGTTPTWAHAGPADVPVALYSPTAG